MPQLGGNATQFVANIATAASFRKRSLASYRKRGKSYEFKVTRRKILPAPGYRCFTFDTIEEGEMYCTRLERLLDQGIVPSEILNKPSVELVRSVADLMKEYQRVTTVTENDRRLLRVDERRIGGMKASSVNYDWAELWVTEMKQRLNLSPGSIRHHVGSVARCFDWAVKKGYLMVNPLRALPKGYAKYTKEDKKYVQPKTDQERERRLERDEEMRIRGILKMQCSSENKQRPLILEHGKAMLLMFDLALETAMRMREIYTLGRRQIHLKEKTIFLTQTKNGDRRQVPLSTVAIGALEQYFEEVPPASRGKGDLIFPFWNGDRAASKLAEVTSTQSKKWARVFEHAGCPDIRFHDLRHEATCRFYERTTLGDVLIAKITGHKDLKMLKRYANLRGSDLAGQLW